jgi:predicted phosphodiesterase
MSTPHLAITADLHWGLAKCEAGNLSLVKGLQQNPPQLLLVGGDLGADSHFGDCLDALATIDCQVALVAGNHDIWVRQEDLRGNSWTVYDSLLPAECEKRGFHYLDHGPLLLPHLGLGIVGSMNWYDHTWATEELARRFPQEQWRLEQMCFTRGRHNDRVYVRWPEGMSNSSITSLMAAKLAEHLRVALNNCERVILITHHPALPELGFARPDSETTETEGPSMDQILWEAFSGNRAVENLVRLNAERLSLVISGHTHRWRSGFLGKAKLVNVGSDYPVKNLIRFHGLDGAMQVEQYGPN